MDESRQSPSGAAPVARGSVPPPALVGFLLLLALVFAASWTAGAAAGPVAPGMHGTGSGQGGGGGSPDGGGSGGTDMGGMGGMDGAHGGGH
jgi:hypothetical protein